MSVSLRGTCKRNHRHSGECMRFYYSFRIRGKRYRGAIPEARTKWQAEQAELRIRQEIFEGRFGKQETGKRLLCDFIDAVYLPWAKTNKKSWREDEYKLPVIRAFFTGKSLSDISPFLIEKFKIERLATDTKHGTTRSPTTVNLEFALVSRILSLAVELGEMDLNPCFRVRKLKLDNQRYRYLYPEEEPQLKSVLTGPRAHLFDMVSIAIGTGLRKNEQLSLKVEQLDFPRNVVIATRTKARRNREVPMNSEVREILLRLARHKRPGDYVFVSPKTGTRFKDIKHSFQKACELADIEGLVWHDLRATFGTRLGEAGFDAFTIASLMGHSDVRTTQRYVRATELNKRSAVEASLLGHNLATREQKATGLVAVNA
ncbi:MAG: tyrosine-type recombinase/integrase [Pyrinomonadaceae bacterium]